MNQMCVIAEVTPQRIKDLLSFHLSTHPPIFYIYLSYAGLFGSEAYPESFRLKAENYTGQSASKESQTVKT